MKVIEIRRHSIRESGEHLSQKGVTLARKIGENSPKYARVTTSTLPRAFETAIAMGFAVDEQLEMLSVMGPEVDSEIYWNSPYETFAQKMTGGSRLEIFANELRTLIERIAIEISDNAHALVITHGGIVQAIAAACLPDCDHSKLGGPPSYCEGIELHFEKNSIAGFKSLKV